MPNVTANANETANDELGPGAYVVLAGGVGAARFLEGLLLAVPPADVTAIVNVGDDMEWCGLHIAPDIDTVVYTLAGQVNPETGWGVRDDTYVALERLGDLGGPSWFKIGDRDVGLHLARSARLAAGDSLSEVTASIVREFELECTVIPVTDDRLRTIVRTDDGEIAFQEYFVQRRQQDDVRGLRFEGAEMAEAAPGVHKALTGACGIIIAPSNPFLSLGPILAVPGVRDCMLTSPAPVAAVSPIVGGAAIKGPAAAMLASLGHEVSALGVARLYQDFADVFVIDNEDAALAGPIADETGMTCLITNTIMSNSVEKMALARATVDALMAAV